jgi:pimeloyl-ACP methyl ester carboxylesterase
VPDDYSFAMELDGLDRFAAERGYEQFHLFGYSISASIALAYVALRIEPGTRAWVPTRRC